MKKILISLFITLSITSLSIEKAVSESGKNIILLEGNRYIELERSRELEEFNKLIELDILEIRQKKNEYRTIVFSVTNNTKKDLQFAEYGIKFRFADEYSLRKIVRIDKLEAGEVRELKRSISVDEIRSRDLIFEVRDFKFSTR